VKLPGIWERKGRGWFVEFNGKQVKLGNDKAEAEKKYTAMLRERGLQPIDGRCRVHYLIDEFWEWYSVNQKKKTVDGRRPIMKSFRAFIAESMDATDVRPFHIQKWIASCKGVKANDTKKTWIAFVQRIFNWGVDSGYIPHSPIARMKKPSDRPREEYIPPHLFQTVISAAPTAQLNRLITFMLDTGVRPEEVVKLEAKHFSEENSGTFVLPLKDAKGNRYTRVIYLTPTSLRIAKKVTRRWKDGPCFRNSRGKPWNRDSIGKSMRKLRDKLNKGKEPPPFPRLCATMLRHSFAHYRISQGQDIALVAALMGHRSTKMVYTRYGHIDQGKILANAACEIRLPGRDKKPKKDENAA